MNQAQKIIDKFGHSAVLAEALSDVMGREVHRQTVARWRRDKPSGGTGGMIPQAWHRHIIEAARARGVVLNSDDFMVTEI